jgi:hypothetical protein
MNLMELRMRDRHPKQVEDYTAANLILIFVNVLWIFGVVWSTWGIGAVVILGLILNHLIGRLSVVRADRARADAATPPRVRAQSGGQAPTDRA